MVPHSSKPSLAARGSVGAAGAWLPHVELKTHLAFRPLFHGPQVCTMQRAGACDAVCYAIAFENASDSQLTICLLYTSPSPRD